MASPQLRKLIKPLGLPRNRADFVASIASMEGGDIDDLVDRLGALDDQDLAGVALDAIDSDINDPTVGLMELADMVYGPEQAPAKTGIRGKTDAPPEKIESNLPDSKADKDTLPATPKEQGSGKKGGMDADTKYLKDKGFGPDYEWDSPEQRADTLASLREQDAQKGKGGKKSTPKKADAQARSPEMQRAMEMAEQARAGTAAPDDPSIVMAGGMPGYEDVVMPTPADMGATMMDAGDFESMYNVSPYSPPPPTPEEIERHRMAQMFNRMGDPRYQYRPEPPAPPPVFMDPDNMARTTAQGPFVDGAGVPMLDEQGMYGAFGDTGMPLSDLGSFAADTGMPPPMGGPGSTAAQDINRTMEYPEQPQAAPESRATQFLKAVGSAMYRHPWRTAIGAGAAIGGGMGVRSYMDDQRRQEANRGVMDDMYQEALRRVQKRSGALGASPAQ